MVVINMTKGTLDIGTYKETGMIITLKREGITLKEIDAAHGTMWLGKNSKGEEAYSHDIIEVIKDLR
jgi:hypothetical protein